MTNVGWVFGPVAQATESWATFSQAGAAADPLFGSANTSLQTLGFSGTIQNLDLLTLNQQLNDIGFSADGNLPINANSHITIVHTQSAPVYISIADTWQSFTIDTITQQANIFAPVLATSDTSLDALNNLATAYNPIFGTFAEAFVGVTVTDIIKVKNKATVGSVFHTSRSVTVNPTIPPFTTKIKGRQVHAAHVNITFDNFNQ